MCVCVCVCLCAQAHVGSHICGLWLSADILWGPQKASSVLLYYPTYSFNKVISLWTRDLLFLGHTGSQPALVTLSPYPREFGLQTWMATWMLRSELWYSWLCDKCPALSVPHTLNACVYVRGCNNWYFINAFSLLNSHSSQGLEKRFG